MTRLNGSLSRKLRFVYAMAIVAGLLTSWEHLAPSAFAQQRISYSDILKDPDNLALNLSYARQQIDDGDVKGASATFERVLLLYPNDEATRLLYAVVLFRLDNPDEARRELMRIEKSQSPAIRKQAKKYLSQVNLQDSRTRFTLNLTAGGQIDTNPSANPTSERVLIADVESTADGIDTDQSVLGVASLSMVHDLGFQAGHKVFAKASTAAIEQIEEDSLDIEATSGELGGILNWGRLSFRPTGLISTVRLADEQYQLEYGGKFAVSAKLSEQTNVTAEVIGTYQDFDSISVSTSASLQSGMSYVGKLSVSTILSPAQRLSFGYQHTEKLGSVDYYKYSYDQLYLTHLWSFSNGMFVASSIKGGSKRYEGPDTLVSSKTRDDTNIRLRSTFGTPINSVLPDLLSFEIFDPFQVLFSAEYYKSESNLTNYTYDNLRGQALLNMRLDF